MDESINTANNKQIRQKPPLSVGRIASEVLGGMGMGFAIKLLVACIESIVFLGVGGEADTRMAFMATLSKIAPPVYGIVGAVGVYLAGSRGKRTGSLKLTLVFGFLAGLLVTAIHPLVLVTSYLRNYQGLFIRDILELLLQPIAATIGFNLTRKYKDSRIDIVKEYIKNLQKPTLGVGGIACEILVGMVAGPVFVFLSLLLLGYGAEIAGFGEGCMDGLAALGIALYVGPLAYVLGCAISVYYVGVKYKETGSFLAALGGGFLGLVVILVQWPLAFLTVPIMTTLGYNLSRRYK